MEAIGRLAGGIAHDFNNLLTAIVGYSALVSDDLPPDSPPREHVGEIQRAASIAGSLTRQLLIFSRKDVVQPVEDDLNESVTRIERLLPASSARESSSLSACRPIPDTSTRMPGRSSNCP